MQRNDSRHEGERLTHSQGQNKTELDQLNLRIGIPRNPRVEPNMDTRDRPANRRIVEKVEAHSTDQVLAMIPPT